MIGTTGGAHGDEMPESQRVTLPSPQPFPAAGPRDRSPGAYRIVNDEPIEGDPSTRRSGRMVRAS